MSEINKYIEEKLTDLEKGLIIDLEDLLFSLKEIINHDKYKCDCSHRIIIYKEIKLFLAKMETLFFENIILTRELEDHEI